MKMQTKDNIIDSNIESKTFGIAVNAEMFKTISARLYTDPIMAIVRELVANAIDANKAKGVDTPVRVHLPSVLEPYFSVEDDGIGMDEETVMELYTVYGNSNKRDTNDLIGGLGLGSKTPFSYTDQFTIESGDGKVRKSYVAFLDKGIPNISKPFSSVEDEKSGTKITISVEEGDFNAFLKKSIEVFLFTETMPEITHRKDDFFNWHSSCGSEEVYLEAREALKQDLFIRNSFLSSVFGSSDSIFVVMGGIKYKLDTRQVFGDDDKYYAVVRYLRDCIRSAIVFHLPIGSVSIQASREELYYDNETIETLRTVVLTKIAEYVKSILM